MRNFVLYGDCITRLKEIPTGSVQTCVTSPPYFGLRDYDAEGQVGLEVTHELYVQRLVDIFREVRRVLREDGTLWLNLGDSYTSGGRSCRAPDSKDSKGGRVTGNYRTPQPIDLKPKDLMMIPARVALALQADGWWLRSDIIWSKGNPMPESVKDRPTRSHEYVYLLTKSQDYYYNADAIREPFVGAHGQDREGRNKRTVWDINPKPYKEAHFATFPPELPEVCIKAGSRVGDLVLDPFAGSGTTLMVAKDLDRDFIGIELNEDYRPLIEGRITSAIENAGQRENFRILMSQPDDTGETGF